METKRRQFIKRASASLAALTGLGLISNAGTPSGEVKEEKTVGAIAENNSGPLFSSFTRKGDIIYLSGIGAHVAPFEIKAHTKIVLDQMEKVLKEAGSSMNRVLKVSVFLNDIADYQGMNEVFAGRFGPEPPVRTTVAVAKGGVPGDSLVEMDCIAYVL